MFSRNRDQFFNRSSFFELLMVASDTYFVYNLTKIKLICSSHVTIYQEMTFDLNVMFKMIARCKSSSHLAIYQEMTFDISLMFKMITRCKSLHFIKLHIQSNYTKQTYMKRVLTFLRKFQTQIFKNLKTISR